MTEPTALVGTWSLSRVVEDRLTGDRRDVRGTTTLVLETPDRVRWSEEGTMTWGGHAVPVSRTLFVERHVERAGGTWFVHFADGRLFHPWAPGRWVDHPCAPDHYRGLVEIDGEPVSSWTVQWQASGPEKDYVMSTVHTPTGETP